MTTWPFADPPNVAVFTTRRVIARLEPITYVSHDEDDGAWQFHGTTPPTEADAAVVALETIVNIDPSVAELADLPFGWCASRQAAQAPWVLSRKP